MRKIIPPDVVRALDDVERKIVGREHDAPVIVIEGGLPLEDQRPHCAVRYGKHVWHRTANEGEDEAAFLRRVRVESQLRGGVITVIGGLPPEPRDDMPDGGETWTRVE
jgi:hypothetical protein